MYCLKFRRNLKFEIFSKLCNILHCDTGEIVHWYTNKTYENLSEIKHNWAIVSCLGKCIILRGITICILRV